MLSACESQTFTGSFRFSKLPADIGNIFFHPADRGSWQTGVLFIWAFAQISNQNTFTAGLRNILLFF